MPIQLSLKPAVASWLDLTMVKCMKSRRVDQEACNRSLWELDVSASSRPAMWMLNNDKWPAISNSAAAIVEHDGLSSSVWGLQTGRGHEKDNVTAQSGSVPGLRCC